MASAPPTGRRKETGRQEKGGCGRALHTHRPFVCRPDALEIKPSTCIVSINPQNNPQILLSGPTAMDRGSASRQRLPGTVGGAGTQACVLQTVQLVFLSSSHHTQEQQERCGETQALSLTTPQGLRGRPGHLLPAPVRTSAGHSRKRQTQLQSSQIPL